MLNLLHFVPLQASWISNWFLEFWLSTAIRDYIKPITIPSILSHAFLIGGKKHGACSRTNTLDLDESQLARSQVKARTIIAKILHVYIIDLPALGFFMVHNDF